MAKFFDVFDVAIDRGEYEQRKLMQLQQDPQLRRMSHQTSWCRGSTFDEAAHAEVAAAIINLAQSIQDQRGESAPRSSSHPGDSFAVNTAVAIVSAADALEDQSDRGDQRTGYEVCGINVFSLRWN